MIANRVIFSITAIICYVSAMALFITGEPLLGWSVLNTGLLFLILTQFTEDR